MKRYEYPPKIARISTGLMFAFSGLAFWFTVSARGWMIAALLLVYSPLFALRPLQYIVLKNDELWYARLIGRGRVFLSDVKSITSKGTQVTLHTPSGRVRLPGLVTDYWEYLRRVVDGAKNAEVDSCTRELLDKESSLHKRFASFLRIVHVSANIMLPGAAVLAFIWLLQAILTR